MPAASIDELIVNALEPVCNTTDSDRLEKFIEANMPSGVTTPFEYVGGGTFGRVSRVRKDNMERVIKITRSDRGKNGPGLRLGDQDDGYSTMTYMDRCERYEASGGVIPDSLLKLKLLWRDQQKESAMKFEGVVPLPTAMVTSAAPLAMSADGWCDRYHGEPDYMASLPQLSKTVSDAISFMNNELGVVHGDVKPDNIAVDANEAGKLMRTKLIDYGATDVIGALQTAYVGTKEYMPPPVWLRDNSDDGPRHEVDPSHDAFAVAATVYYLTLGKPLVPYNMSEHSHVVALASIEELKPTWPCMDRPPYSVASHMRETLTLIQKNEEVKVTRCLQEELDEVSPDVTPGVMQQLKLYYEKVTENVERAPKKTAERAMARQRRQKRREALEAQEAYDEMVRKSNAIEQEHRESMDTKGVTVID